MPLQEEEIIVLIDEDNNQIEFEIIELFETDGEKYAFLLPIDDDEESIIMKVALDEDEQEILVEISNDEEWEKVIATWDNFIEELKEEQQ